MDYNTRIAEIKVQRDARKLRGRPFSELERLALKLRNKQFEVEKRAERKAAKH